MPDRRRILYEALWIFLALALVAALAQCGDPPETLVDEIVPVAAPNELVGNPDKLGCGPNPCLKIDCNRPKRMEMT